MSLFWWLTITVGWVVVGLIYALVIFYLQYNTNKRDEKLPSVWWEWPILAGLIVVLSVIDTVGRLFKHPLSR